MGFEHAVSAPGGGEKDSVPPSDVGPHHLGMKGDGCSSLVQQALCYCNRPPTERINCQPRPPTLALPFVRTVGCALFSYRLLSGRAFQLRLCSQAALICTHVSVSA